MKVIATHENADFDAFAALVAAAKLFPWALAAVPRNMNRNVRDFHSLYQDQLPLHLPADLPEERIETLVLVDTQALPQLRGVDERTDIVIIDHHNVDRPLPHAAYEVERTGSATTILAERMLASGQGITSLEATLFLLGIYEDTGNLIYSGTTPRDARAAAFLMEQGANLHIAHRFLSYPLTEEQRQLYAQLVQSLETLSIEGATIAVASAEAGRYVEEVSVLAHRLSDLYEPEALFILVGMGDHVQLVARGSNGALNVGAVASHFGGGGHRRAAAALIRGEPVAEVRRRLVALLPDAVEPAKRVRQIMSFGVHVLSPETKVSEAAFLMQRYGHEGFPVVDGERLVGMITRREIDRAMHHGLQRAPVRAYMRAGDASVTPETGVREVQRLMTEHGLGQLPVVDGGKVVGIVTRTDLLKLWSDEEQVRPPADIGERLRQSLPRPVTELVEAASRAAGDLGYDLYAVGGFVRDLILGIPNLDLDFVVEGDAIALARGLAASFGGEVRSHRRFGTAKWYTSDFWRRYAAEGDRSLPEHVDFATARTEFYEGPSALPVVERSSIKQDLHRRDFTINTLAVYLNPKRFGEVLDFFGGLRDLETGVIRVLHSLSFVEDPTRMLRAVRLEARLGFRIEPRTEDLIRDALELLDRTSGERIAHELLLTLQEDAPERALARLQDLGILDRINCALRFATDVATAMASARPEAKQAGVTEDDLPSLYLSLLVWDNSAEEVELVIERLRLSRAVAQRLREIPRLRQALTELGAEPRPSDAVAKLDRHGDQALLAASIMVGDGGIREMLRHYAVGWRHIAPAITGEDLRRRGLPPGPRYREILDALRSARLDGIAVDRADEERLLEEWLRRDAAAATQGG